jgi:hypothetical protein
MGSRDTHTLRDRRPSTAACPAWIELVFGEEKYFVRIGPTRAAKIEQKFLIAAQSAQQTNQERIPFICPLCDPIHLSFNSQQGAMGSVPGCSFTFGNAFSLLSIQTRNLRLFRKSSLSVLTFQAALWAASPSTDVPSCSVSCLTYSRRSKLLCKLPHLLQTFQAAL